MLRKQQLLTRHDPTVVREVEVHGVVGHHLSPGDGVDEVHGVAEALGVDGAVGLAGVWQETSGVEAHDDSSQRPEPLDMPKGVLGGLRE